MIRISTATPDDAPLIRQLAEMVWWPTYRPILSEDQIRYMLDKMYDPATIKNQISTHEQTFILLYDDDNAIGFAAYSPRTEDTDVYKLHKLYCLVETKGMGYGRQLLQAVEKAVKDAGKSVLELNVNRYNPAVGFYDKMGFTVAYTEDIDIGNNYWMHDYVMRKTL